MNDADIANDLAETQRAAALRNHRESQTTEVTPRDDCAECGELIPPARLAALCTDLCVDCAQLREKGAF